MHNQSYTLRIKVTRNQSNITTDIDFTLTLTDPCRTTTLTTAGVNIPAITVGVGLSAATASQTMIADSASTTYAAQSLSCGNRTYSILTSANAAVNWVIVAGTTTFVITATPTTDNLYQSSPITLKLRTVLASYSDVTADINFTVNVNRYTCVASGDSATSYTKVGTLTSPYAYTIASTQTFNAPTFTTSPYTCDEIVTYSLALQGAGSVPSYISINASSGLVTINSSDTSLSANVLMRIVVTRTQGATPVNLDFTLTHTNPCSSASLNVSALTITDITVALGAVHTSSVYAQVPDSAATTANLPNLCGARTYTVKTDAGAAVDYAYAVGTTTFSIVVSPNRLSLVTGSAISLKLEIGLTSYGDVTVANKSFTVTVTAYVCNS